MNNDLTAATNCPCDAFQHPGVLRIGAGLTHIPRQLASFNEFRTAMLAEIRKQPALSSWNAREEDDLGVMLLEMWAYLCDSLSFYDEVIAHECYLGTARKRPSLRKLVSLLGYLPKPASAAQVYLAAFAEGNDPVKLPSGTAFRSSGFNNEPPQVFELDQETKVNTNYNQWAIRAPGAGTVNKENPSSLYIDPAVEISEETPLFIKVTTGNNTNQILEVSAFNRIQDLLGNIKYSVDFKSNTIINKHTKVSDLRCYTFNQYVSDCTYPQNQSTKPYKIELDGVYSNIKKDSIILVKYISEKEEKLAWVVVSSVSMINISVTKKFTINKYGVSIEGLTTPVTQLTINESLGNPSKLVIYYNLQLAGKILDNPDIKLDNTNKVVSINDTIATSSKNIDEFYLFSNKNEIGARVSGKIDLIKKELSITDQIVWDNALDLPAEIYGNVLSTSRGETVKQEILGNGNASLSNQSFKLKKKPLTYLSSPEVANDWKLKNTLEITVDGFNWKEVSSFYQSTDNDMVFIVRQDDDGESWIIFGDGKKGKRLPTGVNNVIASYRYGAGSAKPPALAIKQVANPVKGLKSVKNPCPAFGGQERENVENIRDNASRFALLLGRAVSLDDIEVIVKNIPSVRSVKAISQLNSKRQRQLVKIWYIGSEQLKEEIRNRIKSYTDPNLNFVVEPAPSVTFDLTIVYRISQGFLSENIKTEITKSFINPKNGLLSLNNIGIGKPLFWSEICKTLHAIRGVHSIIRIVIKEQNPPNTSYSYPPGEKPGEPGKYEPHGIKPGANRYFDFESGTLEICEESEWNEQTS